MIKAAKTHRIESSKNERGEALVGGDSLELPTSWV